VVVDTTHRRRATGRASAAASKTAKRVRKPARRRDGA